MGYHSLTYGTLTPTVDYGYELVSVSSIIAENSVLYGLSRVQVTHQRGPSGGRTKEFQVNSFAFLLQFAIEIMYNWRVKF